MNRNFQTAFSIFFLLFICSISIFGQDETSAVERSSLVGVSLPTGAQRVNDGQVPAEIIQTLEKLVAQGDGKFRQGENEVLLWTGSDLTNAGGKKIIDRLTSTLTIEGWQYEVGGTADGITVFSILKGGSTRRAIMGIQGEMNGALVVAWTELHAANGEQTSPKPTATSTEGSVTDYIFTAPAGWSRSESAGKITLTKDDKSLAFLPMMESSGNLERDADRIIWQVFKGSGPWSGNGFEPDYGTFEKGKTVQGLDYFRVYRYAKRASDSDPFPDSRFDAVLLLVKVGGQVAVVAGRAPFQSDYSSDSPLSAIDLILYDLQFRSSGAPYNVKGDLLGSWSGASGSVGLAYTFNPNGSFNKGGAIQFRTSHDATRDKVTTTSYGMTDTYSLAGNVLTTNYKRTGESFKYKVRIFDTKYNKDAWQHKLGFLPIVNPDRGTIVLKRDS